MERDDVADVFGRIPEVDHAKTQVVLRAGASVSVDTVVRFEPTYFVVRGREAGNQDEGRAFFLPYDEVVCVKIERMVKLDEIEAMFTDRPDAGKKTPPAAATDTPRPAAETPPPAAAPLDPQQIAKQNLLDRIRAARSVVGSGRPNGK